MSSAISIPAPQNRLAVALGKRGDGPPKVKTLDDHVADVVRWGVPRLVQRHTGQLPASLGENTPGDA